MNDQTETIRRAMIANGQPADDFAVAANSWTTDEFRAEFEITGFMAPFVVARRRSDGKIGSAEFTHSPRVYFNWEEHKK
jgi:hypothetical protein